LDFGWPEYTLTLCCPSISVCLVSYSEVIKFSDVFECVPELKRLLHVQEGLEHELVYRARSYSEREARVGSSRGYYQYRLSYSHQVTASLHNSQYHSVCAVRIPLGIDR